MKALFDRHKIIILSLVLSFYQNQEINTKLIFFINNSLHNLVFLENKIKH